MRLRFLRRQSNGYLTSPDEEEMQASIAAFQMSEKIGGRSHAMATAGLCQTISEILKYRLKNNFPNVPIQFGELTFDSNEAIIKYLKREARYKIHCAITCRLDESNLIFFLKECVDEVPSNIFWRVHEIL